MPLLSARLLLLNPHCQGNSSALLPRRPARWTGRESRTLRGRGPYPLPRPQVRQGGEGCRRIRRGWSVVPAVLLALAHRQRSCGAPSASIACWVPFCAVPLGGEVTRIVMAVVLIREIGLKAPSFPRATVLSRPPCPPVRALSTVTSPRREARNGRNPPGRKGCWGVALTKVGRGERSVSGVRPPTLYLVGFGGQIKLYGTQHQNSRMR